jgi:hypothetical protein
MIQGLENVNYELVNSNVYFFYPLGSSSKQLSSLESYNPSGRNNIRILLESKDITEFLRAYFFQEI